MATMNQRTNTPHWISFLAAMLQVVIYPTIMKCMLLDFLSASTVAQVSEVSQVIGSHEPVGAVAGEDVILPCHLEPPFDVTTLRVEWKFSESFVHVYRSRMDDTALQDKKFKNRTSLFHDEMHKGNISLKLTNVSLTDAGNYTCYVPKLQSQVKRGYINLSVDPVDTKDPNPTKSPITGLHPGGVAGIVIAVIFFFLIVVIFSFGDIKKTGMNPTGQTQATRRNKYL